MPKKKKELSIADRRKELMTLWEDIFEVAQLTVAQAKKGEVTITAPLLRELNGFLKESEEILERMSIAEKEEEHRRMMNKLANQRNGGEPTNAVGKDSVDVDAPDFVPFPVTVPLDTEL